MGKVAVVLSAEQAEHYFVPAIKKLATNEWFTSRTSACGLLTPIYSKAKPAVQEELRKYDLPLFDE
jgi:serine/threonine-protein phosphatase 2A regulatory subunit A